MPKRPRFSKRDLQIKTLLDALVVEHKTARFVAEDPISIPHRFKSDPKACEMTAFLVALLTYGQRPKIIEMLNGVMQTMDHDPVGFVENFNPQREGKLFQDFVYRFNRGDDLVFLFTCLRRAYKAHGSLENLFMAGHCPNGDLRQSIGSFLNHLTGGKNDLSHGLTFLFAHPANGGPCKRFNLFLRWAVRHDATDLALWHALSPSELIIPLDTHVSKCNRLLGFSKRKSPNWVLALEITQALRRYNPQDPMAYDYALMGLGLTLNRLGIGNRRISLAALCRELAPLSSVRDTPPLVGV